MTHPARVLSPPLREPRLSPMSYILDALDKAERERKRGQIPSLQNSERAEEPHGVRSPWLWVALFAVLFNALLAGLLIYSSTHATNEAALPPVIVETSPVAPTSTPTPAPAVAAIDAPIHRAAPPIAMPTVLLMTDQDLQMPARQL